MYTFFVDLFFFLDSTLSLSKYVELTGKMISKKEKSMYTYSILVLLF